MVVFHYVVAALFIGILVLGILVLVARDYLFTKRLYDPVLGKTAFFQGKGWLQIRIGLTSTNSIVYCANQHELLDRLSLLRNLAYKYSILEPVIAEVCKDDYVQNREAYREFAGPTEAEYFPWQDTLLSDSVEFLRSYSIKNLIVRQNPVSIELEYHPEWSMEYSWNAVLNENLEFIGYHQGDLPL